MSQLKIPEGLRFDESGLIPVVVQDRASGDVLMVAHAHGEAIEKTAATKEAHFWSRSRARLWRKGETSGNTLRVVEMRTDCDRDTLLAIVEPAGPACHTGIRSCFGAETPTAAGILEEIARVIAERLTRPVEGSYTVKLLAKGLDHTLKKLGEEATEVILAAKGETDERLAEESADLLFHLLVVLHQRGLGVARVMDVLRRRRVGDGGSLEGEKRR